ncbi:hypothetical protein [Chitinibacter sp. S2-10]|uniref:hypothetical protein n=1 Tax=Chitinibacter sp. S2-10 TaxID=3373597 RepID=UPI003977BCE6
MQILISNLPVDTSIDDVLVLLTKQLGAPEPTDVRVDAGDGGRNAVAFVRYPDDSPAALGKVLDEKISGLHYKGHDLDAAVTHKFKE